MDALSKLNRMDIGIVLKIENKESFNNLPDLLLTAMKWSNKGPHIMETITTLLNILQRMEAHHNKKQGTLRQLSFANEFFNKEAGRFI